MKSYFVPDIEFAVARSRIVLSVASLIAVYVDPTQPLLTFREFPRGWFRIDPYALCCMLLHLGYSVLAHAAATRAWATSTTRLATTTWGDVVFGAAIALFTEGVSSPFYAFFAFAVIQSGLLSGFHRTMLVTVVSLLLYMSLFLVSGTADLNFYVMRPVYLAIVGYLVAYMGQQRLDLEAQIHGLAAAEQRHRIARDLHDGWAQALAGINLRIETSRQLFQRGGVDVAISDLEKLQESVKREYDELRTYMRSLVGLEAQPSAPTAGADTRFVVSTELTGSAPFVDHVLQVLREGVGNVARHARATFAALRVQSNGRVVTITIDDDGHGFESPDQHPWSIASRVRELNGEMRVLRGSLPGAHLVIRLPQG